jgi:trimeric autotransporter adhesin
MTEKSYHSHVIIRVASFSLLVCCLLATGCGLNNSKSLENIGKEQAVCSQTATNFKARSGVNAHVLGLRAYNGLDKGAWALVQLSDGSLVVGGDFTVAGEINVSHVARWNPVTRDWSAMGEGLPDPVHELVSIPGGILYAMTIRKPAPASNISISKLYRWTTAGWEIMSGPFSGDAASQNRVDAMIWDGQQGFYLGGRFTAAGGLAVNGVIHWDGKAWKALEGHFPLYGFFAVRTLVRGPDGRLYAGGVLQTGPDEQTDRVFAWDGQTWTTLGAVLPGPVESLALSTGGQLVAVVAYTNLPGNSGQYRGWNSLGFNSSNQQWKIVTSGFPSISEGFQIIDELNKVGWEPGSRYPPGDDIEAWEGSLWEARTSPFRWEFDRQRPFRVIVSGGKVYTLGEFEQMGGVPANNIAVWDSGEWHSLSGQPVKPAGGVAGQINALVVDHNGVVTVAGQFKLAGNILANNIASWDGKTWQALGSGTDDKVLALAVGPDNRIYVGGIFSNAGGKLAFRLAEWDPAARVWIRLTDRNTPGLYGVTALEVAPDGILYAAGSGHDGYKITSWDGHVWKDLPGIFNDQIMTLETDKQNHLYVGGIFTSISKGIQADGLVRWDVQAGTWVNLGMSLHSTFPNYHIKQVVVGPDGSLFAGGYFYSVNGKPLCNLARVDISSGQAKWSPLAGGLPSFNLMTLGPDGRLYVITSLPRGDGQPDAQAVVLIPGQDTWQLLGGMIGQRNSYTGIGGLAVGPKGLLYIGGEFDQMNDQPAQSFGVYQLTGG